MKRIISIILILILSLGVLSACELFPTTTTPSNTTTAPSKTYQVEAARDYVRGLYSDLLDNPETKRDFTVIASLMFYGDKYTVDWTVDTDAITVTPSADGLEVTVDVPETVEADLNYKLTGTVLAPDGSSAELVFDLVVPAPEVEPVLDMMGTTNRVSYSKEQVVYAANGVTFTNDKASSNHDCYDQTKEYAARAYASSTIKIEYKGMRKILITCDDYSNGEYLTGMDGMVVEGATIIRKNDVIIVLFLDGPVDVFQSANLASQLRIEKIEVFTSLTAEDIAMGEAANGGNGGETSEYQAPAANTAFKWFMEIGGLNYYFKVGNLDQDKYLLTTTDVAEAADIFFEVVDGGYHIYFMDGDVKTYINTIGYKGSKGYLSCKFSLGTEPNCVWTYNETFGILEVTAECDGVDGTNPDTFFAGTYGSYTTISLSGSYYKAQITSGTQFPARLVLSSEAGKEPVHTHSYVDGKCSCGEMDPNYVPPVTEGLAIITAPQVGVAYKFGLYHGNESQNVFFNGENYNNYAWYFAYTPVVTEAMDVYLETVEGVEGGYRLYFNKDGVKTYIVAFPRDGDTTKGTLKFDTVVPSEYFTFSAEYNTLIYTSTTGEQFYIGSSGTYKSISLSAISFITNATSYISHLYGEGNGSQGGETPAPHEHEFVDGKCSCGETDPNYVPPVEGGDNEDGIMSIPEVLASAEGTPVVVKGTVSRIYDVWNTQYSNMSFYISDEDGNELLVFRTGTQVVLGDEVTVTGTATVYSNKIQIAQGGTTVVDVPHVCSEWTKSTCLEDSKCVICGLAGTEKATGHNMENGVCTICGAASTQKTVSFKINDFATANSWANGTKYQTFTYDNVTFAVSNGSNTGKYYTSGGGSWRLYSTESAKLTITAPEGKSIKSVTLTWSEGGLSINGTAMKSGVAFSVDGNSIVISATAKTFITNITVVYE